MDYGVACGIRYGVACEMRDLVSLNDVCEFQNWGLVPVRFCTRGEAFI